MIPSRVSALSPVPSTAFWIVVVVVESNEAMFCSCLDELITDVPVISKEPADSGLLPPLPPILTLLPW